MVRGKGGRPRGDGSPARPRIRDDQGRWRRDSATGAAPEATGTKPEATRAPARPPSSHAQGSEAAAAAVRAQATAGTPAGETAAPKPVVTQAPVDFEGVVALVNLGIIWKAPQFQMHQVEVKGIGIGLEAFVAKNFPALSHKGPEIALATAIGKWLGRLLNEAEERGAQKERDHPTVPSATEDDFKSVRSAGYGISGA